MLFHKSTQISQYSNHICGCFKENDRKRITWEKKTLLNCDNILVSVDNNFLVIWKSKI